MSYKKVLTIQDISCVGQCSLTVALPILSACKMETCILPSAVLSTHTGGFTGYTFRDLSDDFKAIEAHWKKENIQFDAIYTGYLGSEKQIDDVREIMATMGTESCIRVVDPAFADNGKLYAGFDMSYVDAMKRLCRDADILLPNLTEACYLANVEYREQVDEAYIQYVLEALTTINKKTIVLTGISYSEKKTGVVVYKQGQMDYYEHKKISVGCHGTGDIYASSFVGALMNGKSIMEAVKIAADYVVKCIENTIDDPMHFYGAKFEPLLGELIQALKK